MAPLKFAGKDQRPLKWFARQRIAVGAARGLRYLHEECRVGCIVHRDMRPNNILLTHDFEPLVCLISYKIQILFSPIICCPLMNHSSYEYFLCVKLYVHQG